MPPLSPIGGAQPRRPKWNSEVRQPRGRLAHNRLEHLAVSPAATPDGLDGRRMLRRAVHASAYDKNLEEQVRPAVVLDDVIGSAVNPDEYWGPHPTTGVFGPAVEAKVAAGAPATGANGGGSVLDQKVWFRQLEDVEKPPVA